VAVESCQSFEFVVALSQHSRSLPPLLPQDKTLEDLFYEKDVQALEVAFEGQMHFAPFYAYVKLKQQEIR